MRVAKFLSKYDQCPWYLDHKNNWFLFERIYTFHPTQLKLDKLEIQGDLLIAHLTIDNRIYTTIIHQHIKNFSKSAKSRKSAIRTARNSLEKKTYRLMLEPALTEKERKEYKDPLKYVVPFDVRYKLREVMEAHRKSLIPKIGKILEELNYLIENFLDVDVKSAYIESLKNDIQGAIHEPLISLINTGLEKSVFMEMITDVWNQAVIDSILKS